MHRLLLSATILLAACGKPDGGTATDDATTAADTGTTATPTTGASASTTGGMDATGTSTTTGASASSTASDEVTGSTIVTTSTASDTGSTVMTEVDSGSETTASTTGEVDFVRFRMDKGAGPCPPNADCDGFDELLASKLLRVEKFGDVGDPVTEVEISDDDFADAVAVFADPELIALLDGPDPACDPPTDIFEGMLVDDGVEHDAATTLCDQPPIAAARAMAVMLRDKYVP